MFLERALPAAIDRRRAGQTRLHALSKEMRQLVAVHKLDLFRTGPDEAHVAVEDVKELRQLVQAHPP